VDELTLGLANCLALPLRRAKRLALSLRGLAAALECLTLRLVRLATAGALEGLTFGLGGLPAAALEGLAVGLGRLSAAAGIAAATGFLAATAAALSMRCVTFAAAVATAIAALLGEGGHGCGQGRATGDHQDFTHGIVLLEGISQGSTGS
jgi:hypothetical protein